MNAFVLTLGVFIYWWFLGFATVSIFKPRLRVIQSLLISPAVGIAVMLLPVFLINRAGVPIKNFGELLSLTLLVLSILVCIIKRPMFPLRRLWPMMVVLVIALILSAWPMFLYHFDWNSYGNDDMGNYCLAAQRFLNAGYNDLPNLNALFSGRDYSLAYWFMHVAGGMRSGSELMLAVWWAATGLNAHQVFMPIIFALHLSLICATGALVAGWMDSKKAPLMAMSLMAISPLATFGALCQLIGQVGGLTLLCAAVVLFYRRTSANSLRSFMSSNLVGGLVFSAMFIWYPEALPFLGLGWILFLVIKVYQNPQHFKKIISPALFIGFLAVIILGPYIIASLKIMFVQANLPDVMSDQVIIFPYFLIPSGIPTFLGLLPLGFRQEPITSVVIGFGCIILIWIVLKIMIQIRSARPPALVLLVMMALAAVLIYKQYDFGIFKLSMYMQSFLIAVVATALTTRRRLSRWHQTVSLVLLVVAIGALLFSQFARVSISTGEAVGSLNEIPHANKAQLIHKFDQFTQTLSDRNNDYYLSDVTNVVLAKYQILYTRGVSLYFPSRNFFELMSDFERGSLKRDGFDGFIEKFHAKQAAQYKIGSLSVGPLTNQFSIPNLDPHKKIAWILSYHQSIFNQLHNKKHKSDIDFEVVDTPVNVLVFVHSKLGAHYYSPGKDKVSFTQLSFDYLVPGEVNQALGRHALFMVAGPTKHPRMLLELSATPMSQFSSQLPQPLLYGSTKKSVPFVGRGSGRVISEPLDLATIEGRQYIHVDMGRDGKHYVEVKKGASTIYGKNIPTDWRRLTAIGRDISLISEEEYQAMKPPSKLQRFPYDLVNSNLEYSGLYEDGWISEQAFFVLEPNINSKFLVIKGTIPRAHTSTFVSRLKGLLKGSVAEIETSSLYFKYKWLVNGGMGNFNNQTFHTQLSVLINGTMLERRELSMGSYEIRIPVPMAHGRQRIDLAFNQSIHPPGVGGRVNVGKLDFIGFVED